MSIALERRVARLEEAVAGLVEQLAAAAKKAEEQGELIKELKEAPRGKANR